MAALLVDCMPEFSDELRSLSIQAGRPDIAEQIGRMLLLDRCRCGDDFCATFYTGPKPGGGYGPNHENIELAAEEGMIILDLVDGGVQCVEVLYRDEIRSRLQTLLP
jgi:hypothetical protein